MINALLNLCCKNAQDIKQGTKSPVTSRCYHYTNFIDLCSHGQPLSFFLVFILFRDRVMQLLQINTINLNTKDNYR